MRYLIRCDMEGITGVTRYDEVLPGQPAYEASRDLLMNDLLAVVKGLRLGDPDAETVIYDEHVAGRNVRVEQLPPRCQAIVGKPPYRADWVGGLDRSIDAMLLVGFHAMSGTAGGTLPHSYEPDIASIEVNAARVGEIGVEAALAGEMGIPTILYSGDSAGADEADALIPGIVVAAVKESLGENAARCLGPVDSAALLTSTAEHVARQLGWRSPLKLGMPVDVVITLHDTPYREAFERLHPHLIHGDQVVLHRERLAEAWADYWRMKVAAQRAMA